MRVSIVIVAVVVVVVGVVLRSTSLFRFALSRLDSVLLHGHRSGHIVQLEIQPTSVANWIAAVVAPPQCGGLGLAIATAKILSPRGGHALLGSRLGPVGAIGLYVQTAGVADIVSVHVASPQGRIDGPTIDTQPARLASPSVWPMIHTVLVGGVIVIVVVIMVMIMVMMVMVVLCVIRVVRCVVVMMVVVVMVVIVIVIVSVTKLIR